MSWRGIDGAIAAAAQPATTPCWRRAPTLYFDNRQGDRRDEPPGRGRVVTLADVYALRADAARDRAPSSARHVLGAAGQPVDRAHPHRARVEHMTFPRAAAIAELAWSRPRARLAISARWAQLARYRARLAASDSAFALASRATSVRWRRGDASHRPVRQIRYTRRQRPTRVRATRAARRCRGARCAPPRSTASALSGRALRSTRHAPPRSQRARALQRASIALSLEDDAPLRGLARRVPRRHHEPVLDLARMPTCRTARRSSRRGRAGAVQFPDRPGRREDPLRRRPRPPTGELEVRIGGCDGEPIARAAARAGGVSPTASPRCRPAHDRAASAARHDLCLRFTQPRDRPDLGASTSVRRCGRASRRERSLVAAGAARRAGACRSTRCRTPCSRGRMLGDGVAIDPIGRRAARALRRRGRRACQRRAHAVTLRAAEGAEVLLHVGIDTVALKGEGFEAAGARRASACAPGEPLLRFDLDRVARGRTSLVTPVLADDAERLACVERALGTRCCAAGEP